MLVVSARLFTSNDVPETGDYLIGFHLVVLRYVLLVFGWSVSTFDHAIVIPLYNGLGEFVPCAGLVTQDSPHPSDVVNTSATQRAVSWWQQSVIPLLGKERLTIADGLTIPPR